MTTTPEVIRDETDRITPSKRLYRSKTDRIVAGVCGGLGEYFAIDPIWFRLAFIVLAFGGGSGILVYLIMWLVVPEIPDDAVPVTTERGNVNGGVVVGVLLMVVGSIALVNTVAPWLGQYVWPAIFLVGGLALVVGGLNHDNSR